VQDTNLYTVLLPSIARTICEDELKLYDVQLFLGIDDNDAFWQNAEHVAQLRSAAPEWLTITAGFHPHQRNRIPMNLMTRQAYDAGADYIIRINDDSEFISIGWIALSVATLNAYDPPNVGVVGPSVVQCVGGCNNDILTHDMVHRTHFDIFKFYYPDRFDNWYVDDWITEVYQPFRSTQLSMWHVKHHVGTHSTRYQPNTQHQTMLCDELRQGKDAVVAHVGEHAWTDTERRNLDTKYATRCMSTTWSQNRLPQQQQQIEDSAENQAKIQQAVHKDPITGAPPHFKDAYVVITGTARDIGHAHAGNLALVQRLVKLFKRARVVVYENDSQDNTLDQLLAWEDKLGDAVPVSILHQKNLRGKRTENLAHGRNAILRHIENLPGDEKHPDYLLSFDMDGLNHNLEGLETCEALPAGWGGCCVNQREVYYDLWALRTQDDWTNCDVYSGIHGPHTCTCNGKSVLQMPYAQNQFQECILTSRAKHIPKSAPPIQVDSCFGGAAIYDWRYISGAMYAGKIIERNGVQAEVCEHTTFHKHIKESHPGFKLYIKPSFLNDHPREHVQTKVAQAWDRVKAVNTDSPIEDIPEWTYKYDEGRQNTPTRSFVHQNIHYAKQAQRTYVPAPNAHQNIHYANQAQNPHVQAPNAHQSIQDKIRAVQMQKLLNQKQRHDQQVSRGVTSLGRSAGVRYPTPAQRLRGQQATLKKKVSWRDALAKESNSKGRLRGSRPPP